VRVRLSFLLPHRQQPVERQHPGLARVVYLSKAAGKTREEIKALYIAELRSRDLKIPEGEVLDANVDALNGHYVTAARLIGRSVADLCKFLHPPR
jgi:hypothetical protein